VITSPDEAGRLTGITSRDNLNNVMVGYTYGYDLNYAKATPDFTRKGLRVSETNELGEQRKFHYDALYQLTKAEYPDIVS